MQYDKAAKTQGSVTRAGLVSIKFVLMETSASSGHALCRLNHLNSIERLNNNIRKSAQLLLGIKGGSTALRLLLSNLEVGYSGLVLVYTVLQ